MLISLALTKSLERNILLKAFMLVNEANNGLLTSEDLITGVFSLFASL